MTDHALPEPLQSLGDLLSPGPKAEKIRIQAPSGDLTLSIETSSRDSGHLERPVLKVTSIRDGADPDAVPFSQWRDDLEPRTLVWVRLSATSGCAVRALEKCGFRYVSGLCTFRCAAGAATLPESNYSIRTCTPADSEALRSIGGQAFVRDRLFLDPEVPQEAAVTMYGDWSANCVLGLCDIVLAVELDGETAGFVSISRDALFSGRDGNGESARIVLIAVHPGHRRRGLGRLLVRAAQARVTEEGFDTLLVGTSMINTPAQSLYTKCGFSPYYSEMFMELCLE